MARIRSTTADGVFIPVIVTDTREAAIPKPKGVTVKQWVVNNQAKHKCLCGCEGFIFVQSHHHARGIPKFIDGHGSRVKNGMAGRTREKNPHFKGGRYVGKKGYVFVLMPGRRSFNYIEEHRLVMEIYLGRPLRSDEVVHHKNRNKADNRLENLEVMTNEEHSRLHAEHEEIGFAYHRNWGR